MKPSKSPVTLSIATAFLVLAVGCQKARPPSAVPESWIIHSEDEPEDDSLESPSPASEEVIEDLIRAPEPALAELAAPTPSPADPVPWQMQYFITDLAVTTGGWVGALISKGTPSVTLHWRRKMPVEPTPEESGTSDLLVTSETTPAELGAQLEPAIAAAVATKRVRDEKALRTNLLQAATEFRAMGQALDRAPSGPWWVSRFRMDVISDVNGKISPAFEVGGDLRFRFDWFRLQRKAIPAVVSRISAPAPSRMTKALVTFADAVSEDLEALAESPGRIEKKGFRAHTYRIGFGVTQTSDIGIATAKHSLIGHLFFSRDVKKPALSPARSGGSRHLLLVSGTRSYRLDRKKFRKGLQKSLRMANFFTRSASRARAGRWKIYEMKTGLDLNLAGRTGLASITGLATSEISFYNENF